MSGVLRVVVLLYAARSVASSWNSEELALYDLVEEVNKNFYELFGIAKVRPLQFVSRFRVGF